MVAAGSSALDVHDDRLGRHFGGDADDRADLLDGARLEHHVGDADVVELFDQLDGLFQLGDAGTDDQAVDRRAGLAGLLHQPFSADLQLPQVRVEEQRVELVGATRLEQPGQLLDAVVEDRFGDLPAAGELSPVPGVGRGGDDLGVDGGRGHPREQNRRPAGQPGELRREFDPAVGQADQRRGVARPWPGHLGNSADGEEVALAAAGRRGHDADPETADHRSGQTGQDVAGTQVENPAGARLVDPDHLVDPVDRLDQDGLRHRAGQLDIDADLLGPFADDVDAVGEPRRVEAHLDLDRVEDRREDVAAADLVLAVGFFLLRDLLAVQLEAGQLLGGSGDDDRAPAVADRQHRRQYGADVLREVFEQPVDALGVGVADRHHRRAITENGDSAPAGHQRAGGADQLRHRQQLDIARSRRFQGLHGQDSLRVPDDGHRRGGDQVHALPGQGADRGDLGEQDTGQRRCGRGQVFVGRNRVLGSQRAHPAQRLEADRSHHDELAGHRLEQQVHLADQRRQLGFDTGRRHQLFQRLQPRAALTAERDRVGLAGSQPIDQSMSVRGDSVAVSGHSVVLIDRHVCISLNASVRHSRARATLPRKFRPHSDCAPVQPAISRLTPLPRVKPKGASSAALRVS